MLAGSQYSAGQDEVGAAVDASGRLFLTSYSGGAIYAFTTSNGIPTAVTGSPFALTYSGISALLHPNGYYMLSDSINNKVGVFKISGTGSATTVAQVAGSPVASQGTQTAMLALSSNLSYVIAGNGTSRNLSVYGINATTGALTFSSIQASNTQGSSGSLNGIAYMPPPSAVDYAVTVTNSPHTVVAGSGTGNLVYTVTVKNNGNLAATGVKLTNTQTLPAGVTLSSFSASAGTSFSSGSGLWTVGSLPIGSSATLTLTNTVDATAAAGTNVISDSAAVSASDQTPINTGDDSATQSSSIVRNIDLNVTVVDSPHSVLAGSGVGNLTYTVTLTNNGPLPATGVQITDSQVLPTGVTRLSATGSAGTSFNSGTGIWSVPSLAVGATATLTIVDTVASNAATGTNTITHAATVTASNETRINTGDDSASQSSSVARNVDLTVLVTDSPHTVAVGSGVGNLVYTATVTNNGPSDASGIQLTDTQTLPTGATFLSASSTSGTTFNNTTGIWTVPALASGTTVTLTLTNTIGEPAAAGNNAVTDAIAVSACNETRINTADDQASQSTNVVRNADLTVTVVDSPHIVVAGSSTTNLVYTISVKNNGPSIASNVQVTNTQILPAGVTFIFASAPAGTTYDNGFGIWTIGTLTSGTTVTLSLTMSVSSSTAAGANVISDTASVTATNVTLINTGDNSATQTTSVTRNVDFNVSMTGVPNPVVAGSGAGNLVYIVTLKNNGPSDASGVQLNNLQTLPIGVTLLSANGSPGTQFNSGTGVWNIGNVTSGAFVTLALTQTVGPSALPGTNVISDTAAVTASNETRININDDTATQNTSITRSVDLTVTVSDAPHSVIAGSGAGNLVYTVSVANNGPSDASGVQLTNAQILPPGVTLVSAVAGTGTSFDSNTGVWNVGTLPAGTAATLLLTNTVSSSAVANANGVADTATATSAVEPLINTADDSATQRSAIVRSVDLSVSVADAPHTVTAGSGSGNLVYTVTVKNNGPSDATGVQLTNAQSLPAMVTFVSGSGSAGTSFDAQTGIWAVGNLANGAYAMLTLTNTVGASAVPSVEVVSNTASVSAINEPRVNLNDDSATQTTSITRSVDLAVSVVDAPHVVVPGSGNGNLVYTVNVTNNGPSDASGVVVINSQILPGGVTLDAGAGSAGTSFDTGSGLWTIGNLASGASAQLTLTDTVDSTTATDAMGISDTAAVLSANENLINTADDTATQITSVLRNVDLTVAVTHASNSVIAGSGDGNLVYTVTVTNNGPSDASGVLLNNMQTLPAGVSLFSTAASAGTSFDSSTGAWTVGDLPQGTSAALTTTNTVASSAAPGTDVVIDSAAATAANEILINPSDDTATQSTSITRSVELWVTVTPAPGIVVAGSGVGNLVFTITVTNQGPSDASGVQLTNVPVFPGGVTFLSGSQSNGTSFDSDTGVWTVGTLASGATAMLQLTNTVDATAAVGTSVIGDMAMVSAVNESSMDTSGNTASASASVTFALTSGPRAQPAVAGVGQLVTFSAAVAGTGLAFAWDFGDGSNAAGLLASHAYTAAGNYAAVLSIIGDPSGVQSSSVTVTVNAPLVGTGNDSDGDGFSDAFEIAAGSDPNDPESTPTGMSVTKNSILPLSVGKASIKLNFVRPGKDLIAISGALSVPAGYIALGQSMHVGVGGVQRNFILDSKGSAKNAAGAMAINIKSQRGVVAAQTSKYTMSLVKGTFAATLANTGLNNADAKELPVTVVMTVIFNNTVFQTPLKMFYSAKEGKAGSAKN